jgi:plastocyanin
MTSLANQRRTSGVAPLMDVPLAPRWLLIVASMLAIALAGCSSGSAAGTLAPSSPAASAPVATPSASGSAPASDSNGGSGAASDTLQLSAESIQFSTNQLQAPAGRAFTIEFENRDSGISHNVDILDATNTSIFKGAIFPGVATETYKVPAIKAGTYSFICDVHPNIMTGTLTVG